MALAPERARWTRRGLRLVQFTVVYNVIEGLIAVVAGASAGLVSLVGFGLDSAIESVVAVLVWRRLALRLRDGEADPGAERQTLQVVAVTFFLLAVYLVVEGARSLLAGDVPDASPVGTALLIVSLCVMPLLASAKDRVARRLGGDPLIHADAAETWICMWLSASTLAGLVAYGVSGALWLDPLAGCVIAVMALREGREAWAGELVEDDD